MATTFDVIFLGAGPLIDPSEGSVISDDITSENASALVGNTYGTSGNPLYSNIQTFSPGSTGYGNGEAGYYHSDNYTSFLDDEDTFRINGGRIKRLMRSLFTIRRLPMRILQRLRFLLLFFKIPMEISILRLRLSVVPIRTR